MQQTFLKVFSSPPLFSSARQLLVLLCAFSYATLLCAQTIEIRLVNGRNGRPVAGACVNVWVGSKRKDALAIPTDKNGLARLYLTSHEGEVDVHNRWKNCGEFGVIEPVVTYEDSVEVNAGSVLCQPRTPDYSWLAMGSFPTKQLVQQGIVTPNTCGKATASQKPGELILFVRPLNWWEKLKQ